MTKYWIIWRYTSQDEKEYLYTLNTKVWIDDRFLAKRMTKEEVAKSSERLIELKQCHYLEYVEE